MDKRRNLLIIIISLAVGGLITYWFFVRFRVLFLIFFIPLIGMGGGFISQLFKPRRLEEPVGHEEPAGFEKPADDGDSYEEF